MYGVHYHVKKEPGNRSCLEPDESSPSPFSQPCFFKILFKLSSPNETVCAFHTYACYMLHIFYYTVIPRLTSDPANEFFG